MSNVLIARVSTTNEEKFDALGWRNDVRLDKSILDRVLGAASDLVMSVGERKHFAEFYNIDLFTPKGEAYSVQLIDMNYGVWSFSGSDEAFYVFCRWYISVGGRAVPLRIDEREPLAA